MSGLTAYASSKTNRRMSLPRSWMLHIYKSSALTICASSAPSCKVGFLKLRPRLGHFKLTIRLPGGGLGTAYLRSCSDEVRSYEPLYQRVWAFQERTLSPRILEYGLMTARWSCWCSWGHCGRL